MRRLLALALFAGAAAAAEERGKDVYDKSCAVCHGPGLAGAPRTGVAAEWTARRSRGAAALYAAAVSGTPRGMPARGGNLGLKDPEVRAAVDYMLSRLPAAKPVAQKPRPEKAQPPAPPATTAVAAAPPVSSPASAAGAAPPQTGGDINAFNRLMRPPAARNPPPAQDGIHDPALDGTHTLQAPLQAYAGLPRAAAGNRVDWVKALAEKRISPRWDRNDANAAAMVMDLNIVREVKGSMPDVVYPHKQHTEWLDCSNCHPALFVPQKGANPMTMAGILMGQACGACHGKVAFPVSECRLCHSKPKDAGGTAAAARRSP